MATNEYLIPFGVDSSAFLKGLSEIDQGTENLGTKVAETVLDLQKGFGSAGTQAEQLGKKLDSTTAKALGLRDRSREMGLAIADALNGKKVGADLENKLDRVNKLLQGSGTKGKFSFDIDTAKLQEFERMLVDSGNELKVLGEVIDYAKGKLATLDPSSVEFAQLNAQIQDADGFLKELSNTTEQVETRDKSLKTQLKELKAELAAMEIAGKENTREFLQMSVAAGQLEDQIGDISQRVRVLASDTKYIDASVQAVTGLAGAFAAAQGATALFGSENEAVNEIIQKTTGAMAVLQGIQAVAAALNKDSALSVLFLSKARTQDTAAAVAETAATTAEATATTAATTATKGFTAALLSNPITLIAAALIAAVAALVAFTSGSDDAEEAADKLNDTLDRQNTLLKLDEGAINRRANLLVAQAKLQGKTESEITAIEGKAGVERLELRRNNLNETRALLQDQNYISKLSAEDLKKLQDTELQQDQDYQNAKNDLQVKAIDVQIQRNKEAKDAEKKRTEDAKKAAEERKAIIEQEIKFRREFAAAYVDSIVDQYDREREQVKANIGQKIEDLKAEKSLSVRAEREKNDAIALLQQNLYDQLKAIDKKRETDRAALLFEGQQKLADLQAEGVQKELEVLRLGYEQRAREINDQFKNEGDLRLKLLAALAERRKADEKKIQDAAAQTALKEQEERAVLEVETAAKFAKDLPLVEEQKQIEILKVKLDFAQKNIDLLLSQGNAENSTVVLQAKKTVQELQKALGLAQKDLEGQTGGFDLFKLLGLGDLPDDQKGAIIGASKKALESVQEITSFIVDQYQRQIDKKQELIDQETKQIDDLEGQLEDEKALREQGLANNVDTIQAELDAKKRQREEDLKQQEEMQKKQQAVQRAQLALDTVTQASGLITSASNIFKSLSAIPFIGVPLAIATIALMIGAFTTAKVKAFQAISAGKETFGEGGWIDGEKHSRGGKKYYAADGSVRELEQGEHVTKASQAEKYADLLDAINSDDISRMKEEALRDLLHSLGIHLSEEAPREAVTVARERDALKAEIHLPGSDISEDVKSINQGVTYLAAREKSRPRTWTEGGYQYTQKGNKKTRVPL